MTRTEDRLADALRARADAIRDDSLRPLVAVRRRRSLGLFASRWPPARGVNRDYTTVPRVGGVGPGSAQGPANRAWPKRAAALASAAAILLAIALAVGVGRLVAGSPGRPFADTAKATAPPPYFVAVEGPNDNVVTVRSTATGHVTDRLHAPSGWYLTGADAWLQGFEPSALASSQDLLFAVTYTSVSRRRTGLFTFGLTSAGKVAWFQPVPGGGLPALVNIALAVSPDMTRIAIAGTPAPASPGNRTVKPAVITVIDLRTGARTVLEGGMTRPGQQFSIPSLTWSPNEKSLLFVAQWCTPMLLQPDYNVACQHRDGSAAARRPVSQVREVHIDAGPGRLSDGPVLLRGSARYPGILQIAMTRPNLITALVRRGLRPYVVQFSLPGGRPVAVLYHRNGLRRILINTGLSYAELAADGSGRYLIIQTDAVGGWIHAGQFHYLIQGKFPMTW